MTTPLRAPRLSGPVLPVLPVPAVLPVPPAAPRVPGAAGRLAGIGLMTGSAASNQLGAATAALAFPVLGPAGVVAVRQWTAAALLLTAVRPGYASFTRAQWRPVLALALIFATMNLSLYTAIDRIGLGLAVTLEFLGPLSVALLASRRARDLACGLLAAAAVVVLARPRPSTDYLGIALALLAAACWAGYILVNQVVGARVPGAQGPAAAAGVSALLYVPVGAWVLATHPLTPAALGHAAAAGLLSSAVPMVGDVLALRRVPARFFGVFMSVNPVFAALSGLVILGQSLGPADWLAITAIAGVNGVTAVGAAPRSRPPGKLPLTQSRITVDSVKYQEEPMTGPATAAPRTTAPRTTGPTPAQVTQVRAFNRFYTNVIGVLHDMYLDTPYTLTESRLLYEIARHGTVEVSWLRRTLDIDAGYLSRVLSRFESEGLVTRHRSPADARRQEIRATDAGRAAHAEVDARAADQIGALLGGVDSGRLVDAMGTITQVLGQSGDRAVTLRPLAAGDLGWVLQRHGTGYAAEFGWNASFEDFCARIIAEYPALRDRFPGRAEAWIAEVDGVPAGSVFCAPDSETTARLRLLLVEPWARGLRLGSRLVAQCLDFARQAGYADIVLLTYDQLAAARRIYQAAGFTLDSEHPEDAFGQRMMSQTWSRRL